MRKSSGSKTDKKTRRTGKLVHCKHRCGHKYERRSGEKFDKKKRDAFDYHERARCPNLPHLMCQVCSSPGHAKLLKGRANLLAHYKTLKHLRKQRLSEKKEGDIWFGQKDSNLMGLVVDLFQEKVTRHQLSSPPLSASSSVSASSSPVSSPKKRSLEPDNYFDKKARILAEESEPSDDLSEEVMSSPEYDSSEMSPYSEEYPVSPGHGYPDSVEVQPMLQQYSEFHLPESVSFAPPSGEYY
jgi:hypothetical protein